MTAQDQFTAEELSFILDVSVTYLRKHIKHSGVGKKVIFFREDVDVFIKSCVVTTPEASKIDPLRESRRDVYLEVGRALKDGVIVRPSRCSQCESDKQIQGHHHDYSKPLDVIWLCRKCHVALHKQLRNELKAKSLGTIHV